jgi:hypothetical protein
LETQTQRDAAVEPERAQDGGHEAVIQSFYREILGRSRMRVEWQLTKS